MTLLNGKSPNRTLQTGNFQDISVVIAFLSRNSEVAVFVE